MNPSTNFLIKTFTNFLPGIDDYPIFESRVIKAADTSPWAKSEFYNEMKTPAAVDNTAQELQTIAYLVVKDSAIVFEKYWDDYSESSLTNSFSMAKSIVSLLVGVAIDHGYIHSIEQPVSDFLPEYPQFKKSGITIRDLLTMSAGFDWDASYSGVFSPNTKAYYGNNLEYLMSDIKVVDKPGERVYYQSGVTQILAMVLQKAIGQNISDYASSMLWTPMQAEYDALWCLDHKDGMEKAYCCFNSNARDFARFGQLILNKGEWNGRQLVSSEYIEDATNPAPGLVSQYDDLPNYLYGYQFWCLNYKGETIPYYRGMLGQYIFVLKDRNAVVVRLGHKRMDGRTTQHYPADIDVWLDSATEILDEYDKLNVK